MSSSQANPMRQTPRKHLKDVVGTVESLDIKQQIVPMTKATKIRAKKAKPSTKRNTVLKETLNEKGHKDMSKIKCFNCGEYGHFAHDCPKPCDDANIAQESEQNKKVKNMLDLDNISVSEECAMMCKEVQYEDAEEDVVVYGDQGINTEEYKKATYGNLTKTQSEEEEAKYNVALCANNSVSLERKRGNLMKQHQMKMLVRVMPH